MSVCANVNLLPSLKEMPDPRGEEQGEILVTRPGRHVGRVLDIESADGATSGEVESVRVNKGLDRFIDIARILLPSCVRRIVSRAE